MMPLSKEGLLIEASAGTGKTYTLCRIALQLSLEKGIPLDRILTITFTEAATEELSQKLRELYSQALAEIESGELKESVIVELDKSGLLDKARAQRTLRYSLECFDEAPISTIHGFCKRSLDQVSLESKIPLDADIGPVEEELIAQLQTEYIRQEILEGGEATCLAWSDRQRGFRAQLADMGRRASQRPHAKLRPATLPEARGAALDLILANLRSALKELWESRERYLPLLDSRQVPSKLLSGSRPELADCAQRDTLLPRDLKLLPALSPARWRKALKKAYKDSEAPPACQLSEDLQGAIDLQYAKALLRYRGWLSEQLKQAKQQRNAISYNDLLHLLAAALRAPEGDKLAERLGAQYDAALIDEFQDTDPVQLKILQKLFGRGSHYLVCVGDPKQAIYGFRGADLHAYFRALDSSDFQAHRLSRNFRSRPRLVKSVNLFFEHAETGFSDPKVSFAAVEAGKREEDFPPLASEALSIRQFFLAEESARPPSAEDSRRLVASQAANDFANRLNSEPDADPSDFAFLVNTSHEARCLAEALSLRGIASVIRAELSILATQEASEVAAILHALSSPTRQSLKRGALALLLRGYEQIVCSDHEREALVDALCAYLSEWAADWSQIDFSLGLERFLAQLDSLAASDSTGDSEHRHARFSQIGELLAEAKQSQGLSPRALRSWLARKRDERPTHDERLQERLSNDAGRPQILTIHKSKGLQFPIVILPFANGRRSLKEASSLEYHEPDGELIIDFENKADSEAGRRAETEALAESARLLYVALTRAEREMLLYLAPEEISPRSRHASVSHFAKILQAQDSRFSSQSLSTALADLAEKSCGLISHRIASFPSSKGLSL